MDIQVLKDSLRAVVNSAVTVHAMGRAIDAKDMLNQDAALDEIITYLLSKKERSH